MQYLHFTWLRACDVCLDDLENTFVSEAGNEYFLIVSFIA
jgi:hypothetical protein